jgi:hypothetical protein
MGFSQHAGMVIVCDGSEAADQRLERVLWNDPATGVMLPLGRGDPALDLEKYLPEIAARLPGETNPPRPYPRLGSTAEHEAAQLDGSGSLRRPSHPHPRPLSHSGYGLDGSDSASPLPLSHSGEGIPRLILKSIFLK